MPLDQCRCETHENFLFKLTALKINYHNGFWKDCLCQGKSEDLMSPCWTGACLQCSKGILLDNSNVPETVKYQEWILDDEQNRHCVERSTNPKSLHLLLLSDFPSFQNHVQVKRIQESSFNQIKSKSDVGLIQIDFAMAYSCEYQNEIQSALWSRDSINLFTLARFVNQNVDCHLFVLDNYKKDKDAIFACLKEFYANTTTFPEEHVFSDGPSSKFKNKYMMKLIQTLGKTHSIKEFHWNFFATGHGKGVVDGIGGEAKSLVRQHVLSKTKNVVVQCASDFANVCKDAIPWCNCSPHDSTSSELH